MDTQEIDSTLDELENRLDRLRALYEQYFLGIEKIEPAVARKDVDRRFWLLRRTQIRNTARRWRLQVLIQRYNTFQQYWTRICREIENGTYVRHLLKAKKNLGAEPKTWAAKKRMGLLRRGQGAEANGAAEPAGESDLAGSPDGAPTESGDTRRDAPAPPAPPATVATPRRAVATLDLADLGPLDLDFDEEPSPPPRPVAEPTKIAPAPKPSLPTAGSRPESPATSPAAMAPARAQLATAAMPIPGAPGPPPTAPAANKPGAATPQPAVTSAPNRPGASAAQATGAEAPLPGALRRAAVPASVNPVAAAPSATARPSPVQAPAPKQPAPAPAAVQPPAPAPGAAPRPAHLPAAAQRPQPAQAPAGAPPAARGPAPAIPAGALSDERVRKLHAELIETRRQLKQGDNVSIDSLARSLRETEKKLRAQHEGRTVDFQIVVKDGKPVVKPVLRK